MKLTDIVVELGKVQTAKDRPAFKTPQQIEKEGIANPITQKYDFKKLDFKYPIEHYNLSGAKNVICIFTSGIGRVPEGNYNKISLLNLFKFKNDSEKINWKTFMDKIGDDILYPNSFDELESIINN